MSSESSCSLSVASVDRRVLGRSIEMMRRVGQPGGCGWGGPRNNLQNWDPWTNETKTAPHRGQRQSRTSQVSDSATSITKSAGSVYDFIVSQEMHQVQQQQSGDDANTNSDLCTSFGAGTTPARPRRSNSNTNNKNPFSLAPLSNSGLRDVQRHKADGKQTTIITQFKPVESYQDGKVHINILMDSESNVPYTLEESSEDTIGSSGTAGSEDDANQTPGEADEEGGGEGEGVDDSDQADDFPAPGDEKKGDKSDKKKLNMSHLDKEGIVVGCMNVFADVSRKEYIVLLSDKVVEAFLVDPGQFRSIAKRTGCEIEVTRRILNRRIGMYRWVKYLVVTLRGPHLVAIDQCDRLMVKAFPPYKIRKPYPEAAQIVLFVKESYPDNSDLYFNFQRTGSTSAKVGDLRLQTPFGKNEFRPIENTPWKLTNRRLMSGILEPRNAPMANSVQHAYPEWGSEMCTFMDESCKWEQAGDLALDAEKKKTLERSMRVKERKLGAETLFAGTD